MKRTKTIILSLLLLLALLFGGCGDGEVTQNDNSPEINTSTVVTEIEENDNSQSEKINQNEEKGEDERNTVDDSQVNNQEEDNSAPNQTSKQNNSSFNLNDVPVCFSVQMKLSYCDGIIFLPGVDIFVIIDLYNQLGKKYGRGKHEKISKKIAAVNFEPAYPAGSGQCSGVCG